MTKREEIANAARVYGERSFDNYVQIRSIAENIRDGLCAYLDPEGPCVFLVPPQGAFAAQNYRSAAYSVSGKGFLPLEPISFGLAIRISGEGDYMRLVLTCRKEGERMYINIEKLGLKAVLRPMIMEITARMILALIFTVLRKINFICLNIWAPYNQEYRI